MSRLTSTALVSHERIGYPQTTIKSPNDLSALFWLSGSSISASDNDPVATWPDLSGNGNDGTQGTSGARPLYKTNIFNGRPIVRFDATNDGMECAANFSTNPVSFFLVANYTGASGARRILNGNASNWLIGPYLDAWTCFMGGFRPQLPSGTLASTYGWIFYGYVQSASQVKIFNWPMVADPLPTGKVAVSAVPATEVARGVVALGASGLQGEVAGSDLAEVGGMSSELSNADMFALYNYFRLFYNVS